MHFPQAINSDLSVLIVCSKTGGKIKKEIYKKNMFTFTTGSFEFSYFSDIYINKYTKSNTRHTFLRISATRFGYLKVAIFRLHRIIIRK